MTRIISLTAKYSIEVFGRASLHSYVLPFIPLTDENDPDKKGTYRLRRVSHNGNPDARDGFDRQAPALHKIRCGHSPHHTKRAIWMQSELLQQKSVFQIDVLHQRPGQKNLNEAYEASEKMPRCRRNGKWLQSCFRQLQSGVRYLSLSAIAGNKDPCIFGILQNSILLIQHHHRLSNVRRIYNPLCDW